MISKFEKTAFLMTVKEMGIKEEDYEISQDSFAVSFPVKNKTYMVAVKFDSNSMAIPKFLDGTDKSPLNHVHCSLTEYYFNGVRKIHDMYNRFCEIHSGIVSDFEKRYKDYI